MKVIAILLAATLLGGCASIDSSQFNYGRSGVQVWGHASGDNWELSF